jgi:two-component system, OmpR family, sensor histidine kinase PrrB
MRRPWSLRGRITAAAVLAVVLTGTLAGAVLLREIQRDGRSAVDDQLQERASGLVHRGVGPYGGRHGPGPDLLAGSGTFVQLIEGGQVVEAAGDVPPQGSPAPSQDGLETVMIDGSDWRSLTVPLDSNGFRRVQLLSSLAPVEARVAHTRRVVVVLGLAALALTALAAWGFTTIAVRPLARLRSGAAAVSSAEDLGMRLPEDDGPVEVRSLASALNEMLARLRGSHEALNRALLATRRFAADAGHEMRTPLTGMRANLDTLARNPGLPADQRAALLGEVTAEQDRIVHLLEGLQALARGEAAETLPREDSELGDLVDAAVYAARRRHPAVRFELDERIQDAKVRGWSNGLRLVVDNLLDNAAIHGREHGRVLVLLDRAGDTLVLRVEDDGPGIPEDQRERVLEPFARGEHTPAPGTGLGLAIVAQQVALHDGVLRLGDSQLGGLAVEIRLPVHEPERPALPAPSDEPAPA